MNTSLPRHCCDEKCCGSAAHREGLRSGQMISTREEAELVFRKWLGSSSRVFFAAFRPNRTVATSFYGKVITVSENAVALAGEQFSAEVDLSDAQFAFVTERDLPIEVRQQLSSSFDSGIFINQTDGSMFALFEVEEES